MEFIPIMDAGLVIVAMGCWITAALVALARPSGGWGSTLAGLLGSGLAIGASLHVLLGGPAAVVQFPFWGTFVRLELDALSAAFLLPLHVVAALGAVYARSYWPLTTPKTGRYVGFFYGLLAAALTAVFVIRHGVFFLVGWEIMATAAFFLVGTEHERPEVRKASWVYLVCTHTGTLVLIAMVVLLGQRLGHPLWLTAASAGSRASSLETTILVLATVGFLFKAGAFPLHFWLPSAHASAPSHVSAILSSVMLKTGIYGLLRISSLLPPVPHLGGFLIALGSFTAVYGIACAIAQGDYKRLLAYSSVENIGIILMGIGLGFAGRAAGNPWLTALSFGAALFHVWNHSFFKSLLFFGAGAILHATGTRNMESLGGLATRMPKTALVVFPGLLAVSALPPFNGFVSEWFLYRGFFASFQHGGSATGGVAICALSLTGGLAAVAFAKFFGIVFLGLPRSERALHAHDPARTMWVPMAILATLCLALSLGSRALLPVLDRVVAQIAPGTERMLTPGLGWDVSLLSALSAGLVLVGLLAFRWLRRSEAMPRPETPVPPTWDCGYAEGSARMQYTASSFGDGWTSPFTSVKKRMQRIQAFFPAASQFRSDFRDLVGDRVLTPRMEQLALRLHRYRRLQQGHLPVYILYILVALLAVFLWMLLRPRLLG